MTDQPLDPAAIMAAHRRHERGGDAYCDVCMVDLDGETFAADWPCESYRLAAALAAAQEREQRVRALHDRPHNCVTTDGARAFYTNEPDNRCRTARAALAGEGVADHPRPFHSLLTTTDRNAAGTLHLCTASCGWGWRSLTEDEARGKWSDAHTHGEGTR